METHYLKVDESENNLDTCLAPAVEKVLRGIPVVVPTETVYGIGALMLSNPGMEAIYRLKGRDKSKKMAVLIATTGQLQFLCEEVPEVFEKVAAAFLPGPLTVILKAKKDLPSYVTQNGTIAIRFSSHPVAQRLVELAGAPLALTSANLSGLPSSIRGKDALEDFNGSVDTIIDSGVSTYGFESTILSLADPEKPIIFREGVISKEALEKVIQKPIKTPQTSASANGALERYYVSSPEQANKFLEDKGDNQRSLVVDTRISVTSNQSYPADHFLLKENNFYLLLRTIKKGGYKRVVLIVDSKAIESGLLKRKLSKITV